MRSLFRLQWFVIFLYLHICECCYLFSVLESIIVVQSVYRRVSDWIILLQSLREQVRLSHQQAQRECHQKVSSSSVLCILLGLTNLDLRLGIENDAGIFCWRLSVQEKSWPNHSLKIHVQHDISVKLISYTFLKSFQFHKAWGQLMKTGYQNSRFGQQVTRSIHELVLSFVWFFCKEVSTFFVRLFFTRNTV